MTTDAARRAEAIRARAREVGFPLVGIAAADPTRHMGMYRQWLSAERHGSMGYLAREDAVARRADLSETLDGVRSILVVAEEYGSGGGGAGSESEDRAGAQSEAVMAEDRAVIARYARGRDYHFVLSEKLESLLSWIHEQFGDSVGGRVYVDTGPVLERDLGQRAGLGWFGRNTMLINPSRGSWFVLGSILLDLELEPDAPGPEDRCGSCHACLHACPTGALLGRDDSGAPVIDARRCISYLTIESKGTIPEGLRSGIGNRVFGCDICQEVCPWNERFGRPGSEAQYSVRADLDGVGLVELTDRILGMSEKGYQRAFAESPLARPRRKGMLRNLCVGLGNWGSSAAIPVLGRALADSQPLVRAHAAWALGVIGAEQARGLLGDRLSAEVDPEVRREIEEALAGKR